MDNVIKQGYLKKGNSTEGGVFSGIIEKMTPKKWYMLVVRNRVPYLEQYERDVDVFSSAPSLKYDLSKCTSISRTMSTTARTYSFVVVCPDQLIELIANTREQMRDWCDALERTLSILGVFKNEKEEHIYTFCPAASNVVGRTLDKKGEEDDEKVDELGAVGGTPATPPPRQLPPPLPGGHPSLMQKLVTDPDTAYNSPSPPPLPRSLHHKRQSGGSPTEKTPSPTPPRIPPFPTLARNQASPDDILSTLPPPLPPGRSGVNSSVTVKPPPLPPGRPKSLPAGPGNSSITSTKSQIRGVANGDSDENESSDTDCSSDFVSGAFWEINRKIPIPTARRATLASKPHPVSNSGAIAAAVNSETTGGDSDLGETEAAVIACGFNIEDLDEGYSDLVTVTNLKKPDIVDPEGKQSDKYVTVNKKSSATEGFTSQNTCAGNVNENKRESETRCNSSVDNSEPGCCLFCVNATDHSDHPGGDGDGPVFDNDQQIEREVSEAVQDHKQTVENFYAPFPIQNNSTPAAAVQHKHTEEGSEQSCLSQNSSTVLTDQLEPDGFYACAFEASSLPTSSVPPLPLRQDSLLSWRGDNPAETSANNMAAASATRASVLLDDASTTRHIPSQHKTFHPTSSSPVYFSSSHILDTPPLPPRRVNQINTVYNMSHPPPLPSRKAQSFHSQRPACRQSMSSYEDFGKLDSVDGEERCDPAHTVVRQKSFSGSDLSSSENYLRRRMRLEREHSLHSVISLKQSQAELLRQEMELPGVTVTVTAQAAQSGIALVDFAEAVCIAGWNQKDFPSLHGKFHIGDQLISICNVKVTSASAAQKMLKHSTGESIEMLLKRTPHAAVLAIRRSVEGENIGIKRNGGTAEIQYVDPNGLAASNGLPLHPPDTLGGHTRSNWVLTEINSRSLNLFFKDNEIEHRLNAVGREITIVVQPSEYISELKKQLKKIKNFKNYIVQ